MMFIESKIRRGLQCIVSVQLLGCHGMTGMAVTFRPCVAEQTLVSNRLSGGCSWTCKDGFIAKSDSEKSRIPE